MGSVSKNRQPSTIRRPLRQWGLQKISNLERLLGGVVCDEAHPVTDSPLTSRQERYVSFVLSGLGETEAARQAGYGPAYAKKAASRVGAIPAVKAAIQTAQTTLREKAMYDVEQAVAEIDKAVIFAYAQKNPMSIAKLLENKGKLFGLYVDRYQEIPVDLRGALERAQRRILDITSASKQIEHASNGGSIEWTTKIPGSPVPEVARADGQDSSPDVKC
jgi:hypothetical protein